jgi:uncharacterized protein
VVDTFDGSAWVGLVPFSMEGLGFTHLHPLPIVGAFPEVNVRTYVHDGHRRGAWFFSLDIDRLAPAVVARAAYRIPYCTGDVRHVRAGPHIATSVERRWPRRPTSAITRLAVRAGEPLSGHDELVRFLTARWGLFSSGRRGTIRYAPVDHPPWPLHDVDVHHLDDTLVRVAGLPTPGHPPHAMYSPGVDVRVGRPRTR